MRYFITGANGFVGKELVKILKKKGKKFIGIDTNKEKNSNIYIVDIRDKNLHKYIPKNSIVVHLAGVIKPYICKFKPIEAIDINLNGTINLIKSAEKKNVKKIIFASSEWVYGHSKNKNSVTEKKKINLENVKSEYALSKIYGENFINLSDKIKTKIILRFGILYGARKGKDLSAFESLFHEVKTKNKIVIGCKKTARKFVNVIDLANAVYLASKHNKNDIFNLTGDQLITLEQIIKLTAKKLKKNVDIIEKNHSHPNIRNISNIKAKNKLKWNLNFNLKKGIDALSRKYC